MHNRGMRGFTGDSVPTSRVIRSQSHVVVRVVPKGYHKTKPKIGKVTVSYRKDVIEQAIARMTNSTVRVENSGV